MLATLKALELKAGLSVLETNIARVLTTIASQFTRLPSSFVLCLGESTTTILGEYRVFGRLQHQQRLGHPS